MNTFALVDHQVESIHCHVSFGRDVKSLVLASDFRSLTLVLQAFTLSPGLEESSCFIPGPRSVLCSLPFAIRFADAFRAAKLWLRLIAYKSLAAFQRR